FSNDNRRACRTPATGCSQTRQLVCFRTGSCTFLLEFCKWDFKCQLGNLGTSVCPSEQGTSAE
ncbi:hypothetical protein HDU93_004369, partial [Gonapodya sp. JEL0774]